jgi:hypothetical protein
MQKVNQQDCYYRYGLGVRRLKRMHGLRLRQYQHVTKTRKASKQTMMYGKKSGMKAKKKASKKDSGSMKMKMKGKKKK